MFYVRFVTLCNKNNVSRTKACVDCGVSRTAWHKWEDGATPNGTTINKFAAYFGVSVAYLLGEDSENTPPSSNEHDILDDIDVAFYGDYKELSEDDKETLRAMARVMKERRARKDQAK